MFFFGIHRLGAGAGGLTTDIEDVRACREEIPCLGEDGFFLPGFFAFSKWGRGKEAIPRKTIRGQVQDAHHVGAFTPGKAVVADGQGFHLQLVRMTSVTAPGSLNSRFPKGCSAKSYYMIWSSGRLSQASAALMSEKILMAAEVSGTTV